jgi:hypothetical protein
LLIFLLVKKPFLDEAVPGDRPVEDCLRIPCYSFTDRPSQRNDSPLTSFTSRMAEP